MGVRMNEKDLFLLEHLKKVLGDPPHPGPFVMDVKTTQFVRVELVLLKLLAGDGRRGLFISVDRPHQYMVHLLTMHQIEHENLTFLDAVARFVTDNKQATGNVCFLEGPSNIDTLPEALKEWSSRSNGTGFDMNSCSFAVIDNLAALLSYNSHQIVQAFLDDFVKAFDDKVTLPLIVDRERNPDLFQMASANGRAQMDLRMENVHMNLDRPQLRILDHEDCGGIR
jgi:hypothetical protein